MNNDDEKTKKTREPGPVWVGYLGETDPRAEDYARRRFRLGDEVPREVLLATLCSDPEHPRLGSVSETLEVVADLELEVSTALVTENTNGATCANAWVKCVAGAPEPPPTELDRELVKNLADAALRDLEDRQAPQSVRNAAALLVELANGRAVMR